MNKVAKSASSAKYFSIQLKPFKEGELLDFDLYRVEEKKVILVSAALTKLSHSAIKILEMTPKIYMKQQDFKAFREYYYHKQLRQKSRYKNMSLESVTDSIKANLRHIYLNSADTKSIQKLYPLATDLSILVIANDTGAQELLSLIQKDYHTYLHSLNVAIYSAMIAKELSMEKSRLQDLILSALLHDVGKTKIDEKILYKKEPLTHHELKIIKMHATMGFMIAKSAGIHNKEVLSGIHHHHERLDGSGYPNKFRDKHISEFARIIGICDIYAAMSSNRIHKASKKPFEILTEMKKELEGKLDKSIINALITVLS